MPEDHAFIYSTLSAFSRTKDAAAFAAIRLSHAVNGTIGHIVATSAAPTTQKLQSGIRKDKERLPAWTLCPDFTWVAQGRIDANWDVAKFQVRHGSSQERSGSSLRTFAVNTSNQSRRAVFSSSLHRLKTISRTARRISSSMMGFAHPMSWTSVLTAV